MYEMTSSPAVARKDYAMLCAGSDRKPSSPPPTPSCFRMAWPNPLLPLLAGIGKGVFDILSVRLPPCESRCPLLCDKASHLCTVAVLIHCAQNEAFAYRPVWLKTKPELAALGNLVDARPAAFEIGDISRSGIVKVRLQCIANRRGADRSHSVEHTRESGNDLRDAGCFAFSNGA